MTKPAGLPEWDKTELNSIEPDADHKEQGWLAPGGIPEKPPFQTFNHWQNNVYKWLKYINDRGVPAWDANSEYEIGAIVVGSDGNFYSALTGVDPAFNVGNDPVGDVVNWSDVQQASNILYDNTTSGLVATDAQAAIDEVSSQTGGSPLVSVGGSVSGSTLTLSLNASSLDFRDTVTTSGLPVSVQTTGVSLAVSPGSTLGTIDTIKSKIVIVAINNAGTMELACINMAGGVNLDETTLIDTVAEGGSGGADLDNVFYSTTARSGVAFRVVGYVESTQAVAGTWSTAPSLVQGAGGVAVANMGSIGHGQTWQLFAGAYGVTYYNTTGRPITVILKNNSTSSSPAITITPGVLVAGASSSTRGFVTAIVGAGMSYIFGDTGGGSYHSSYILS